MTETAASTSSSAKTAPLPPGIVRRTYRGSDNSEYVFDFLIVDDPEKWVPAEKITGQYDMPMLGRGTSLRFNLTGVSSKAWEEIEIQHPISKWNFEGRQPDDEFMRKHELEIAAKQAHIIELSSGKIIPGENHAAKAVALQKMNGGEVEALYRYIQSVVCGTEDGRLFQQFKRVCGDIDIKSADVMEFTDFTDWQKASEFGYVFRMQRPGDDFILEFPLKNISSEAKQTIESETRDPEPPQIPDRDPTTGKMMPHKMVPDYNDSAWLIRCRAVAQKRITMFFNACLPFQIPGQNLMQQYEWLSCRLVGDVVRVQRFIEDELCGYRSRFDFFTLV